MAVQENKKKDISLVGAPIDLGSDRRGVDMGPTAIRIAGLERKLSALPSVGSVADSGDLSVVRADRDNSDNNLKYLTSITDYNERLARRIQSILDNDGFPITLGGDHSLAIGSIAGVAAHCRAVGKKPAIVWIDAHGDLNDAATSPSGNIHGMPLAVSMGIGHKKLTSIAGFTPKITSRQCALIGIRALDGKERERISELDFACLCSMADIDRRGIAGIVEDMRRSVLRECDHLHISFDIDSMDPFYAAGVGTPVSGGLTLRESHYLMEELGARFPVASIDMVEVNPILDDKNNTAEIACDLVLSAMGKRIL